MRLILRLLCSWLISMGMAKCVVILSAAMNDVSLPGLISWAVTLFFGLILWPLAHKLTWPPIGNRYHFRTRVMRWLERQFPLLPAE